MTKTATMGAEEARKMFPSLVESASRGKTTIITKHGKPFAAVVPVAQVRKAKRPGENFLSLRGTGKGMYGDDVARYIDELRNEWD